MKSLLKPLLIALPALLLFSCKTTEKTACIDPAKINPDGMCIEIYDPVCGCDNKTYGNSCVANNAGVTAYTKGECK